MDDEPVDEPVEESTDFTFEVPADLALPTLFEIRPWLHPGGDR